MAATYRQDNFPLLARVAQPRNYMTDSFPRAVYILAKRAVSRKLLSFDQISAKLQLEGYAEVPERTVRFWVKQTPDLPEQLIDLGLVTPEYFPGWTRRFLRTDDGVAPMAQESRPANRLVEKTEELSPVYIAGGILAAWLGYKIARAIFRDTDSPSRNSLLSPSTPRYPWLSD